jgi:hypothetical protein
MAMQGVKRAPRTTREKGAKREEKQPTRPTVGQIDEGPGR